MSKHTPGPWETWGDDYVRWPGCKNRADRKSHSVICSVSLPGANELRTLTGGYGDYQTAKEIRAANARLIAAAPDLLAACQAMVDMFDRLRPCIPWGKTFLTADVIVAMNEAPMKAQAAISKVLVADAGAEEKGKRR